MPIIGIPIIAMAPVGSFFFIFDGRAGEGGSTSASAGGAGGGDSAAASAGGHGGGGDIDLV